MNKEELRQYSAKLLGEKEELQQRIDKAIEILKAMKHSELMIGERNKGNTDKLLDILKGNGVNRL